MAESRRRRGITRVGLLVIVCASGFLLVGVMVPGLARLRQCAFRISCGANLSNIGKAMLAYANDYQGQFPRAGGRYIEWGRLTRWNASDRYQAFGLAGDDSRGEATISASLYLLVKYRHLPPEAFVCRADAGTTPFKLSQLTDLPKDFKLTDAWDFGPEAYKHCSYSYHMPYGLCALTTSCEPAMAVTADRNPWIESQAGPAKNFGQFKPDIAPYDGSIPQGRHGNAIAHGENGQNVLFVDGHAAFQKRAYCGLDNDNIYLISNDPYKGSPLGTLPAPSMATPSNRRDSVLVNDSQSLDPASHRAITIHEAKEDDSKDLTRTVVVATLDCPLPEHKNAIWCSTFQMAWDKFKQDIIRDSIQVIGAEELAKRLNQAPFPGEDIEEKSYYTAAGFASDGIVEQIQKEMSRRFPSEPVPAFDKRYKTLPRVALAYAYLNVDVGFAYPYYTYQDAFDFEDSNGVHAAITAFCAQNRIRAENHQQVRDQVEVLYHDYGEGPETAQYAVDLCRHTEPYQVVLARMPRADTFRATAKILQDKIAAFTNDPNYEVLRKLRPIDTLIVPDVLYKLTHHFDGLLGKHLANPKWQDCFFFEAMQKIDFTLSRTGVVLKSEALTTTAGRMSRRQLELPRRLHFDRPFLICVKKREAGATPFFLMWVDNVELMNQHEGGERQ